MVLLHLTLEELFFLGLKLAGFSVSTVERTGDGTSTERFKDKYYACPRTVEQLLADIQDPGLGEAQIENPKPRHLLLTLYYLKKYPTKHDLAAFLDSTEKTSLKWVHMYVKAIQALKGEKVSYCISRFN
jgi:hypothetical protein